MSRPSLGSLRVGNNTPSLLSGIGMSYIFGGGSGGGTTGATGPTGSTGSTGPTGDPGTTGSSGGITFEANDTSQASGSAGIFQIYGDQTTSTGGWNQKRSGIKTTASSSSQLQIQNTRDISSYIVGDPTVYSSDYPDIQSAIDQAVTDGVDNSINRRVQILIRPGVYPNPVNIPLYGIHLIGLSEGNDRSIKITGVVTVAAADAVTPKGVINLFKGIYFSVGGDAIIGVPAGGNSPSLLFVDCFLEGDIRINDGNGDFYNCLSANSVYLQGASSSSCTYYRCQMGGVTYADNPFCVVVGHESSLIVETPATPQLSSTIYLAMTNCDLRFSLNQGTLGNDHTNQGIQLDLRHCVLGDIDVQGNISYCKTANCYFTGNLTLGDPVYVPANPTMSYNQCSFSNCSWNYEAAFQLIKIYVRGGSGGVTGQKIAFLNCVFPSSNGVAAPVIEAHDIAPGAFVGYQTVSFLNCIMGLLLLGDVGSNNLQVIMKNCLLDISGSTYAPLTCIYADDNGGVLRLETRECNFTLGNLAGTVTNASAGTTLNWVNSYDAGATKTNTITDSGATSVVNAVGGAGTTNQLSEGCSV